MKRILSLALAAVMMLSLAACGSKEDPAPSTSSAGSAAVSTPVQEPVGPKTMRVAENVAPTNLHGLIGVQNADAHIQNMIHANLYQGIPTDGVSILTPVLAEGEPVDVNGDGTVWNIKVSPNAKWENGEAMNADTFVYSMKMALDPNLLFARANYNADNHIPIKNAVAYYTQVSTGVAVAWEDVGVKKVDEMTIQITTESPVTADLVKRHFSLVATSPVYEPLFEQCLSADRTTTTYGSSADTIISSGAFKVSNWVIGAVCELEKNEYFPLADQVNLDTFTQTVVEDANTQLQMFEAGELDYVEMTIEALEQYGDDPRVVSAADAYTRTIDFCDTNTDEPILANENFKKAIFYATDRATITKLSGDLPATGFVTPVCKASSDGTTFRTVAAEAGYEPENYGYDPALAKEYFDKALAEEGLTSVEISLLCNSGNADHAVISEFIQEDWAKIFGADRFKLVIDAQPSKQQLAQKKSCKENPKAYELTISDWGRTNCLYDPVRAIEVYTSTFATRNAPYHNDQIDAIFAEANLSENRLDMEKRVELTMQAEQEMLASAMSIPVLYNAKYSMIADHIVVTMDAYDIEINWAWAFADIAQ